MHKSILTFLSAFVLLVIGCEQSSINDPFNRDHLDKNQQSDSVYHQGVITLEGMLNDPRPIVNSYFLISGELEYEYWFINSNGVQDNVENTVSVNLTVCAELINVCSLSPPISYQIYGQVNCGTCNTISFSGNILNLQEHFPVLCPDEINLVGKFSISPSGLELESTWLELSDNNLSYNVLD